jgi:hypothetical protein
MSAMPDVLQPYIGGPKVAMKNMSYNSIFYEVAGAVRLIGKLSTHRLFTARSRLSSI